VVHFGLDKSIDKSMVIHLYIAVILGSSVWKSSLGFTPVYRGGEFDPESLLVDETFTF
jgi:hypothetical protein